jgi:hypothetical protein
MTKKCVEVLVWFIDKFQILPQHVSAVHCHHQGVVHVIYLRSYSDNICVLDVYGLQFVQCGQVSRDVTKSHPSTTGHTVKIVIHIYAKHRYCLSSFWGKYDHLMMAMNSTSTHLLINLRRYYKMLGPSLKITKICSGAVMILHESYTDLPNLYSLASPRYDS